MVPQLFSRFLFLSRQNDLSNDYSALLSDDVLVEISRYLSLYDILHIRLVSRRFCQLSYTPIIWKRLLQTARLPVPPVPPTAGNSLANIPTPVCEQILRRAYGLEREWKRRHCRAAHNWFDGFDPVHSMEILPGGRYLVVASVELASQKPTISIWDLEFPNQSPFNPHKRRAALVKVAVPGPISQLKAKYMSLVGFKGIVIAALCDTPGETKTYFWTVLYIKLETLEQYAQFGSNLNAKSPELLKYALEQSPPFAVLVGRQTSSEISSVTLETMSGAPYAAIVKQGKEIIIENLQTGRRTFIVPLNPWDHKNRHIPPWRAVDCMIRKIKILPAQRQILVIREVINEAGVMPVYWYELYDMPPEGTRQDSAKYYQQFQEEDVEGVEFLDISEDCYREDLAAYDESINPMIAKQLSPPDICIWTVISGTVLEPKEHAVNLRRLVARPHFQHEPGLAGVDGPNHHDSSSATSFHYDVSVSRLKFPREKPVAIFGGPQRAVWLLPCEDGHTSSRPLRAGQVRTMPLQPTRVGGLLRYMAVQYDGDPASPEGQVALRDELRPLDLPPPLTIGMSAGMSAFAFDESIGRMIIATQNDSLIHVLDYADPVGVSWNRQCQ